MTTFTKLQLKEIEKIFDIQASQVTSGLGELFNRIGKREDQEIKDFITKVVKEWNETFNIYRTISAKASVMQEEVDNYDNK